MTTKTKKAAKKAGKKAPEAVAPSTLSEREERHYREIQELEAECDRLEGEYEERKATASAAKSAWQAAVELLRSTIRRGPDAQMQLPLAGAGDAEDFAAAMAADIIDAFPHLTGNQVDLLDDAGVRTVSELEQLRAVAGLRSVKGFGEAKADKLEDMLLDYLAKHRMKAAAAGEDTDDEDQDGDA